MRSVHVARTRALVPATNSLRSFALLQAAFAKGASAALEIDHNSVYFGAGAISATSTSADTVLLTFELLPENGETASSLARALVLAVGDPTSELYSQTMREECPIDTSFQPDVKVVYATYVPAGLQRLTFARPSEHLCGRALVRASMCAG